MNSERAGSVETVIGPAGKPLTVENLPPKNTMRWVTRRKAEVVAAVRNGRIGRDEACGCQSCGPTAGRGSDERFPVLRGPIQLGPAPV